MRKIIKTILHSTHYAKWQAGLNKNYKPAAYNSSNGTYYYDIVLELFRCQGGLCAFTEIALCASEQYDILKWVSGRIAEKPQFKGNLEHFDSNLKKITPWSWSNFFMADSDINRIKSTYEVDSILKPDECNYNEFRLLKYDSILHIFIANDNNKRLTPDELLRIDKMIIVLGLNHSTIIDMRRKAIMLKQLYVENGFTSWDKDVHQFPTAHAMMELMDIKGELTPLIG